MKVWVKLLAISSATQDVPSLHLCMYLCKCFLNVILTFRDIEIKASYHARLHIFKRIFLSSLHHVYF